MRANLEVLPSNAEVLTRTAITPIGKRLMATQSAAVVDSRARHNDTDQRHPSPSLGLLAVTFTVLKLASIGVVSIFTGNPAFPSPQQPPNGIVA
jgi:hypothetical protein